MTKSESDLFDLLEGITEGAPEGSPLWNLKGYYSRGTGGRDIPAIIKLLREYNATMQTRTETAPEPEITDRQKHLLKEALVVRDEALREDLNDQIGAFNRGALAFHRMAQSSQSPSSEQRYRYSGVINATERRKKSKAKYPHTPDVIQEACDALTYAEPGLPRWKPEELGDNPFVLVVADYMTEVRELEAQQADMLTREEASKIVLDAVTNECRILSDTKDHVIGVIERALRLHCVDSALEDEARRRAEDEAGVLAARCGDDWVALVNVVRELQQLRVEKDRGSDA
jgi:hypothetical protein